MSRAGALLLLAASLSCARARSSWHSSESFSFTHGTAQVAGCTLPPQAWEEMSRLTPGTELVVQASDFDARIAFEAIVTIDDAPRVLVLAGREVMPARAEHLAFLGRVMRAQGLESALTAGPYETRVQSLRAVVALDPLVGLGALATEPAALFRFHVAELAVAALRHPAAKAGVVEWLIELCLGPFPRSGAMRGYLGSGGAGELLVLAAGHASSSRDAIVRMAMRALEAPVDRELVLLACLARRELTAADLRALLLEATAKLTTSGERARIVREVCGHGHADEDVLRAAVGVLERLRYGSDRRAVVSAAARASREERTLRICAAAAGALEFESDREQGLAEVLLNDACRDSLRLEIRTCVDEMRDGARRERLYALLRR